jgi:bifunctional DNA-binding transcriptional regulator/antitoxin component of YhaV-PrlF toxin-antitoxin module
MSRGYVSTVQKDENGELYIIIPEELINELGWKEKDTLEWRIDENNNITLNKILDYTKEASKNG